MGGRVDGEGGGGATTCGLVWCGVRGGEEKRGATNGCRWRGRDANVAGEEISERGADDCGMAVAKRAASRESSAFRPYG